MHAHLKQVVIETLIVGTALAALLLTAIFSISRAAYSAQWEEARAGHRRLVSAAATLMSSDTHDAIVAGGDSTTAAYQDAKQILQRVQASDPALAFLYTTYRTDDGNVRFGVDSMPPGHVGPDGLPDTVALGEHYEDAPQNPAILRAFSTGTPQVSSELYEDKYGIFLSAYTPVLRSDGEVSYVMGGDLRADDFLSRIEPVTAARDRMLVQSISMGFVATFLYFAFRGYAAALARRPRSRERA